MSVSVDVVKKLNAKIDSLNTKRTKTAAQIEVLQDRLKKEIQRYKSEFGVDLEGEDIRGTIMNILSEKEKVSKAIEEEYELKSKVVAAIENGDMATVNKLLGIEDEVVEENETEDTTEEIGENSSDDFGLESNEDEEDFDIDDIEIEEDTDTEEEKSDSSTEGMSVDEAMSELDGEDDSDDEDFDDFGFGDLLSGTKFGG